MSTTLEKPVHVERFNPYVNDRVETHLEFTVFFKDSDGRCRWKNGALQWGNFQEADVLLSYVLNRQTYFVREQWMRIEVCVPNRDAYGNLRSGYVKDTGLLLATRKLH